MNKELMTSDKIGFSTMKMFYENAQLFRKYQKDLKEGKLVKKLYFDFGTAFHKLILQKDVFLTEYRVLPQFPDGKYSEAVKTLVNTRSEYENEETDRTKEWLDNAIFAADLKCNSEALYKKIWENEKDSTYSDMFNKLVELENFKVLSHEDWNTLISMEQSVLNSQFAEGFYLVGIEPEFNIEIHTEKNLKWYSDLLSEPLLLDSTPDRFIIDHNKKKITVLDLKTTSTTISKFNESIEKYDYDLQGYMYTEAIKYNYKTFIESGYTIDYYILAVEKQEPNYCWLFKMESYMDSKLKFLDIARVLIDSYISGNWNKVNGNSYPTIF